ncbi:MAG: hypothetical protein Q4D41_10210 [Prevotellaceae bacterium]|nr:hypothetical protein [Prevotellaceae bacterium]
MIKRFTFLLLAVIAATGVAIASNTLTYKWAHVIDGGTAGDDVVGMAKSTDGNYYVATSFGTTNSSLTVQMDGVDITDSEGNAINGSNYSGTSYNKNLLLQKVDPASGSIIWTVYTRKGSLDDADIVATSDGGVVVVMKTRPYNTDEPTMVSEIVDASNTATTVSDESVLQGEYRTVVVKLDADGKTQWVRSINGLILNDGDGTITTTTKDNSTVNGITIDADDNLYLCGNFRTALYFPKADGTTATLTAVNNVGWTGSSSDSVGDLFVVKLDKDGYYTSSLVASGTASFATIDNIDYNDGKLYVVGRVLGDGTTMTLGNVSIDATTDYQNLILASVNTSDLSVNYVNTLTPAAGVNTSGKATYNLQIKNIQYVDGSLYVTGGINGCLYAADIAAIVNNTAGQIRGYVMQFEAETGNFSAASMNATTGISNYFGVYVGTENVYSYGYNMSNGAILSSWAKTGLASAGDDVITCSSFGSVASCAAPLVDGANIVMMNRGQGTPVLYGTDDTFTTTTKWGVVYSRYEMTDVATAINKAIVEKTSADFNVYSITGTMVKKATSAEEAVSGLAKGIYIIGGKKVLVAE